MTIKFEVAISNNIDIKDITLISYLSLISERENLGEEFADVHLVLDEIAEGFNISDLEVEQRKQNKVDRYLGVTENAQTHKSLEHITEG